MGKQNNTVKIAVPGFFGCSGVPLFRDVSGCSGVPGCSGVFRCSGVPVFRCSGVPGFSTCRSKDGRIMSFSMRDFRTCITKWCVK